MLASIIAGISAVAAIASAVFGYYQYRSAQSLARRNLRLEVQDLNRKLNEEVPTIKKMHEVRKQNLHASFSHAGIFYSSAREKHDREWEADGQKLEVAISKLEPCKRTFDDLDDHQLESKLMDLKTIERAIQFERDMAFEWEADKERMWTRVEAARKG